MRGSEKGGRRREPSSPIPFLLSFFSCFSFLLRQEVLSPPPPPLPPLSGSSRKAKSGRREGKKGIRKREKKGPQRSFFLLSLSQRKERRTRISKNRKRREQAEKRAGDSLSSSEQMVGWQRFRHIRVRLPVPNLLSSSSGVTRSLSSCLKLVSYSRGRTSCILFFSSFSSDDGNAQSGGHEIGR